MLKVLLVEDNARLRAAMKAGLEGLGKVKITHDCDTGEAALVFCLGNLPDVILMDVQLAGNMNGIEAAMQIRRFLPSCKILLFSGQAATADLLESARAQGHEFEILAKPVHPQDLLAKLRE